MLEGDQRVKMGEEDERLELRLSLTPDPLRLNCSEASRQPKTTSPNVLFQLFDWNYDSRSFQRAIDVNEAPATEDCEEEHDVSSPNSTISSLSGKKRKGEEVSDENDGERDSCSPGSGEDDVPDGGIVGGESRRKKLRLSKEQSTLLEQRFKEERTLNARQKRELAKKLKLTLRQVEVWFQNRRARTKLKQKEVDCECMKKWCEKLSRENKRLEKEILELRALLHLPPLCSHCHPIPPTVNPSRSIIPWTPILLGPRSSNPPPKM